MHAHSMGMRIWEVAGPRMKKFCVALSRVPFCSPCIIVHTDCTLGMGSAWVADMHEFICERAEAAKPLV